MIGATREVIHRAEDRQIFKEVCEKIGLKLPKAKTVNTLDDALDFLDEQRLLARPTLVHCLVGEGRTGTVLAAYLMRGGLTPDHALRELRTACPNAVGSPTQETFLRTFATRRPWLI